MAAIDHWYPMYQQRFDSSTADWPLEAVGAYVRLMNHQWDKGSIPDDLTKLASLLRCTPSRLRTVLWVVNEKFAPVGDGRRQNAKLEEVRMEQLKKHGGAVIKGRLGAEKRWSKDSSANGSANGSATSQANSPRYGNQRERESSEVSSPSAAPSENPGDTNIARGLSPAARDALAALGFKAFWKAYPRKVGKRDAAKAWTQTGKERPPVAELLEALDRLKASPQWSRDGGQFIPHPATWLRRGGWDDEPEATQVAPPNRPRKFDPDKDGLR